MYHLRDFERLLAVGRLCLFICNKLKTLNLLARRLLIKYISSYLESVRKPSVINNNSTNFMTFYEN